MLFSFELAVFDPLHDNLDVVSRQAARIAELAMTGFGMPRRHVAALDDPLNGACTFFYLLVVQEGKGCSFAGSVTARAVVEDDLRHMLVERDCVLSGEYSRADEKNGEAGFQHCGTSAGFRWRALSGLVAMMAFAS